MRNFFGKILYQIANLFYYIFYAYSIEAGKKLKRITKAQEELKKQFDQSDYKKHNLHISKKRLENLDMQKKLLCYKAEVYGISKHKNMFSSEDARDGAKIVDEVLNSIDDNTPKKW